MTDVFLGRSTGDAADGMYFIEDGTVSIKINQDRGEVEISKLVKGEYFGELALVTHRPRAASAYAQNNVKVACKFPRPNSKKPAAFTVCLTFPLDCLLKLIMNFWVDACRWQYQPRKQHSTSSRKHRSTSIFNELFSRSPFSYWCRSIRASSRPMHGPHEAKHWRLRVPVSENIRQQNEHRRHPISASKKHFFFSQSKEKLIKE